MSHDPHSLALTDAWAGTDHDPFSWAQQSNTARARTISANLTVAIARDDIHPASSKTTTAAAGRPCPHATTPSPSRSTLAAHPWE